MLVSAAPIRDGLFKHLWVLALVILPSCATPEPEPVSIRLTDLFATATVEGSAQPGDQVPPTEWRLGTDHPSPTAGWQSFHGVTDLTVRDGLLTGTSSDEMPIVDAERSRGPHDRDLLHAVEVRLRVSRGSRVSVGFPAIHFPGQSFDREIVRADVTAFPEWYWIANSPLVPGDRMQTYVMRPSSPVSAAEARHVLVRPTDVAQAEFAIASVRLIFRREHLASIASGVGWHGAGEIYRETVTSRVPETIRYRLRLPSRPRLDLALATLDPEPVTFRVTVLAEDETPAVAVERTVTTPLRWHEVTADLGPWAGRQVELGLALASPAPGAIGLWGSPAIRNLGAGGGVILIVADNLRADHLDAYGYPRATAPALTRLAAQGARFETCTPLASWTKVSMPSILTGLEPLTHGVLRFSDRLPPAAVTLAEVFRQAGFATLSFSSINFAGQINGNEQGFEVLHDERSLSDRRYWSKSGREYVDRLLPWLEEHREVPFFVLLHVLDPHWPFEPRPPWNRRWVDAERRADHWRQTRAVAAAIENPFMRSLRLPSKADLERAGIDAEPYVAVKRDWYDGSIRGLDAELARLFERLRQLGLEETTLIALTSDHGEEFYEHGRLLHGHTVYGDQTRVPLILRGPGVPAGGVVPESVRTIDLMPTLLELRGLPAPEKVQGQSLVPLLQPGGSRRWREEPALITRVYPEDSTQLMDTEAFALVDGGWKLVEISRRGAPEPRYELYDPAADPLDLVDLAAQHPEVVAELKARLERWREQTSEQRLAPEEGAMDRLHAESLERLRALGYVP